MNNLCLDKDFGKSLCDDLSKVVKFYVDSHIDSNCKDKKCIFGNAVLNAHGNLICNYIANVSDDSDYEENAKFVLSFLTDMVNLYSEKLK